MNCTNRDFLTYCFVEGFASIEKNGNWGFINTSKKIISFGWDNVWDFSEKHAVVVKDKVYNFINERGEVVSKGWELASGFREGLARVKKDGLWGWLNLKYEIAIECFWHYTLGFEGNYSKVKKYGNWGVINKNGEIILPTIFSENLQYINLLGKKREYKIINNTYIIKIENKMLIYNVNSGMCELRSECGKEIFLHANTLYDNVKIMEWMEI